MGRRSASAAPADTSPSHIWVRDEAIAIPVGETTYTIDLDETTVDQLANGLCPEALAQRMFDLLRWRREATGSGRAWIGADEMKTLKTGFDVVREAGSDLLDHFAGLAMSAMLSNPAHPKIGGKGGKQTRFNLSRTAYLIALDMVAARQSLHEAIDEEARAEYRRSQTVAGDVH